jgi:hypothetical protein
LQKRIELDRERSVEVHGFVGLRVSEGEMRGVEEVAGEVFFRGETRDGVWGTVECVADDGMTEGLGMDADLVSAAGFDADLDEGEGTIGSC